MTADGYHWVRLGGGEFVAQLRDGGWYMVGVECEVDLSRARILGPVEPPERTPRIHTAYYAVPRSEGEEGLGPGGWSQWQEPHLGPTVYKLSCCDCGLVHDMQFVIGRDEAGERDRVHFRVRRNNRATGQLRRGKVRANGFGRGLVAAVGRATGALDEGVPECTR